MRRYARFGTHVSVRLVVAASLAFGFGLASRAEAANLERRLRIFFDCARADCDLDFFRRELTFVDFVREPAVADVHILTAEQKTGSSGRQVTLAFIGMGIMSGNASSLDQAFESQTPEDEIRRKLLRLVRIGLAPYMAKVGSGAYFDVDYGGGDPRPTAPIDPWDSWVFRIHLEGQAEGETRRHSRSAGTELTAARITDDWKFAVELDGELHWNRYQLKDRTVVDNRYEYRSSTELIRSLGDHWSLGAKGFVESSTYDNRRLEYGGGPGVEYSVFPYAQSTHRLLGFAYVPEVSHARYFEDTVYFKRQDLIVRHSLQGFLAFVQPWGDAFLRVEGKAHVRDHRKHSVEVEGGFSIRLTRGLSVTFDVQVERTKDQINLARGDATDEEVLLRQRELGTDYQYETEIGLRYTFGSIYNNVVNPRLKHFN